MKSKKNKKTFFFGIINKKERWGLSWKGYFFVFLTTACFFIFVLKNAYNFLAPTERVKSKVLVVEGFVGDEILKKVVAEFQTQKYDHIYVPGGPLELGSFFSKYKNLAELSKASLIAMGINEKNITAIPVQEIKRDRTYASALALKEYIENNKIKITSFNLFSAGAHSKRSHLLYNLAFQNKLKIGIISETSSQHYERWWTSSYSFRAVTGELIAYAYSLFFKYFLVGSL